MSEQHTVLSLLVDGGPACAAELERQLHEKLGFLGSTARMVDRSLVTLCADGLIEGTGELRGPEWGPRTRRAVYQPTATAQAEIDRWITTPADTVADAFLAAFKRQLQRNRDWIGSVHTAEEIEVFIEQAGQRAQRARADLADHQRIPREKVRAPNRPWHETIRDLTHNMEVAHLTDEIETMTALQDLARDQLAKLRAEPITD